MMMMIMMMMNQLMMLYTVCSYIDRLMSLLSHNVTSSLTDDQFIFTGEHFYSAVSSTPQFDDHFQQQSVADTDNGDDVVQFNVSSTSSGNNARPWIVLGHELISHSDFKRYSVIFFLLLFLTTSCWGDRFRKSLRLRRFKSERDEI